MDIFERFMHKIIEEQENKDYDLNPDLYEG